MSPNPYETPTSTFNEDNKIPTATKPVFDRQNSSKRRNSDDDTKNNNDEILIKRRLIDSDYFSCPLANFGCLSRISSEDSEQHRLTELHMKSLSKAVLYCAQQTHVNSKINEVVSTNEDYSGLFDSVDLLAEGLSCLQDDNVQIQTNTVQLCNNILEQQNQIHGIKSSVEESIQLAQAIQTNTDILESDLENMRQKIEELQSLASNNGSFIWKITDVAKKINEAMSERQTSIYSPPFYSSPTGYKMCMRLYFYGDGRARQTHLSLFFVLMRGDYDAILEWPFAHKITFCLYDQTKNQRHIIDSFRPDIKSNSFQRPRCDMNIASGIPKFCPLAIIQQDNNPYTQEDCMFIRCMVDFTSTPKLMLPYIFNINPGLPVILQRMMIEKEMEQRNALETEKKKLPDLSLKE